MKYAIFTVSTPQYSPQVAVKRVKDAGYDGIEWRVKDDPPSNTPSFWTGNLATLPLSDLEENAPTWRQMTEDAGLKVPAIATYVKCDELDRVELAMRGAEALGVPMLRIQVPSYGGSEPFTPLWKTTREQYAAVAGLAARHGVKVLLELHHRTIVPSASAARRFLDGLDPAYVGAIYDAGNMVIEGWEHPRMALEVLGPYLAHVHLKNARWTPVETLSDGTVRWGHEFCPFDEGIADLREVMRALRQVGYDGWVTFEDFSTDR
ncbi:MAG: sugar phosphate isomerase/epimerase, partial [Chloroflexota bacterium]|nr:sugar phosphate isomerase/epimerase [Chloroflexota bacterium]